MFTGLIEEIGRINAIGRSRGARRIVVEASAVLEDLRIDDSIAISGVCLTVIERDERRFAVETVEETLKKTTLGALQVGARVNLERALRTDRRLGGHFVQGHVDGVGRIVRIVPQAGGRLLSVQAPESVLQYLTPRGSIAVDGVSLTIAELRGNTVDIALIPHTLEVTTLGDLDAGAQVNIEADMLGKYVYRALEPYLDKLNQV